MTFRQNFLRQGPLLFFQSVTVGYKLLQLYRSPSLLCCLPYTFRYIFINACAFSNNSTLAPRVFTLVLSLPQWLHNFNLNSIHRLNQTYTFLSILSQCQEDPVYCARSLIHGRVSLNASDHLPLLGFECRVPSIRTHMFQAPDFLTGLAKKFVSRTAHTLWNFS